MTKPRQVLCIGGKHDGQWVPERQGASFIQFEQMGPMQHGATRVSKSVYELAQFRVGEKSYWLGVPSGITTQTAFEMLLRGYGTNTPELCEGAG